MPFITGFFGAGVNLHGDRGSCGATADLAPACAAGSPASAAPPRSSSPCSWCRCIGFTAIAVDIGAVYAQRARLQIAADAAALAVAQDCARGACGNMQATASALVAANDSGATAAAAGAVPRAAARHGHRRQAHHALVRPGARHRLHRRARHRHRRLGVAGRAAPPSCRSPSPTASGRRRPAAACRRARRRGSIKLTKNSGTHGCTGPSHNVVPGGFGYVVTDPGKCHGDQRDRAAHARRTPATPRRRRARTPTSPPGSGRPCCCRSSTTCGRHRQQRLVPRLRLRRVQADRLLLRRPVQRPARSRAAAAPAASPATSSASSTPPTASPTPPPAPTWAPTSSD